MTKLLVVDDDEGVTRALSLQLRAEGYEVHTAHSAEAGLELALQQRPDLILLDIDMPGFSGFEFYECLQVTERGRQIPVMYLGGPDNPTHRLIAEKQGVRTFVARPCEMQSLVETIRTILASPCEVGRDGIPTPWTGWDVSATRRRAARGGEGSAQSPKPCGWA